jgi:hypothetical protein
MSSKDLNTYATIKTAAEGALDIALITNNVASIKRAADQGDDLAFHETILGLASFSLALNLLIGLLLIVLGAFMDMKRGFKLRPEKKEGQKLSPTTKTLNAIITALISLTVVVNIAIAVFEATG